MWYFLLLVYIHGFLVDVVVIVFVFVLLLLLLPVTPEIVLLLLTVDDAPNATVLTISKIHMVNRANDIDITFLVVIAFFDK